MAVTKFVDIHSEEYILGQNIRRIRKFRGLSQGQLADLMDMDRAAISNYENGAKGEMGFRLLRKFAHVLQVSPAVLTGDEEFHKETAGASDTSFDNRILLNLSDGNRAILIKIARALLLEQAAGA